MIIKLKIKNSIDVFDFVNSCYDKYEDCYITIDKKRLFLKNNLKLIKKILKYQEVYMLDNKGLMIIFREKGFRSYVKFLAKDRDTYIDLIKFLNWNYSCELFIKLKNNNPLVEELRKNKFYVQGLRGQEILLKKIKEIKNVVNNFIHKD